MAAISYTAIGQKIQSVISTALGSGHNVTLELEQPLDARPWVDIHLDRRDFPGAQPIAAGRLHRLRLIYRIWCWCFDMTNVLAACTARDTLLGAVEVALMADRTLSGNVEQMEIGGGDMVAMTYSGDTAPAGQGYLAGGEIEVACTVTATI